MFYRVIYVSDYECIGYEDFQTLEKALEWYFEFKIEAYLKDKQGTFVYFILEVNNEINLEDYKNKLQERIVEYEKQECSLELNFKKLKMLTTMNNNEKINNLLSKILEFFIKIYV